MLDSAWCGVEIDFQWGGGYPSVTELMHSALTDQSWQNGVDGGEKNTVPASMELKMSKSTEEQRRFHYGFAPFGCPA